MRNLITTLAAAATVIALGACSGGSPARPPPLSRPRDTPTVPAAPSCHALYETWKHGPARGAATAMVIQLHGFTAAASAADVPRMVAALKRAGRAASATAAIAIPHCADPHGYLAAILTRIRSAADNVGSANGLGSLILAAVPLKQIPPLEHKLAAELEQTVGAKTPFGK